jgi:arylsulfatase A-like enzyme
MKLKWAVLVVVGCLGAGAFAKDRPNILWLVSEDNSASWIGCYGNEIAKTPNIDRMAKEGFQYMNVFASAPVCAPSRSTWITGINAISMGTHPMRSRYGIPHDKIPYYPDILREAGYYCANFTKTDYNIGGRKDSDCWDEAKVLDWENLKQHQPFFQVINCGNTHESQAKRHLENTRQDPEKVNLPAYYPDLPTVRKNVARYYDCIENMDIFMGKQLDALKKAGLSDNTIVIYNSDHGGALPRGKRFLFENGLRSPLVIYIPPKYRNLWPERKPGTKVDRLVSFLDMPKTWISLAGATPPKTMQGAAFLGAKKEPEHSYHFAFRGRMDERVDNQRAICDKRFLYIRNYMPYAPWGQKLEYMWEIPLMKSWDADYKAGKTTARTSRFFTPKNSDELYDMHKDPDSVDNLIDNPEYRQILQKMRGEMTQWQMGIYDAGLMPESDIARRAKNNNLTIYELVRNPKLYDLKVYLKLSDLALAKEVGNLPTLGKALQNDDCAIRYWGVVGCFLLSDQLSLQQQKAVAKLLTDSSDEVRGIAAWTLVKTGYQKNKAFTTLQKMLDDYSYAILSILNIIDWMGDDAKPLMPSVASIHSKDLNIRKMQRTLLEKFDLEVPEWAQEKKKK